MGEMEPFSPEEVFTADQRFFVKREMSPEGKPVDDETWDVLDIFSGWADFWDEQLPQDSSQENHSTYIPYIPPFTPKQWEELLKKIDDAAAGFKEEIEGNNGTEEKKELRETLLKINSLLAGLPHFIENKKKCDEIRETNRHTERWTKEQREEVKRLRHELAEWQGWAVLVLGRLGEIKVDKVGRNASDFLIQWFSKLCKLYWNLPTAEECQKIVGKSLSGILGCLAVADIATKAGYDAYLPPAQWDADCSIDLLLIKQGEALPPKVVYPVQVKYIARGEPGRGPDKALGVWNREQMEAEIKKRLTWRDDDVQDVQKDQETDQMRDVAAEEKFLWQVRSFSSLPGWEGIEIRPFFVYLKGEGREAGDYRRVLSGEVGDFYKGRFPSVEEEKYVQSE